MMIVAIFNLLIFLLFFPATVLLIWIMTRSKELWKHWAYKIIVQLAIADLRILLSDGFAGICYFLNVEIPETVARVTYLMFTGTIEVEVLFFTILAFNRLFVILSIRSLDRGYIYLTAAISVWITNIAVVVYLNTFDAVAYFDYKTLGVYLNPSKDSIPALSSYDQVKFLVSCVCSGIATVCYVITVSSLCFQAVLARTVQKIQKDIAAIFSERVADISYNFFYRALPASHFIVFLIFNRTLRRSLLRIFHIEKDPIFYIRGLALVRSSSVGVNRSG
ncbi:hypothetical protein L596_010375 [Steinernema carpocapsae]|uniref:G-protein coupled receptors family 1 profile domain-containing protein n=1 Tax=Steinernema carpocapsae TaxID=34508 RepID=A0A4U5PIV9_STECR|nr:hypothetical protein L596_010375 [Steinernema carpocapsae]